MNCEHGREACVLCAIPTPLDAHDSKCKGEALVAWSHHHRYKLSKLQAIHENSSPSPSPNFLNHHGPHNTHSLLPSLIIDAFNFKILFLGENTLWGGQDCYHIVCKKVHVWTLTMSILWKIFTIFCIYIKSKPKNEMPQKLRFVYVLHIWRTILCALMIQFENTIFKKCEYNHLHIPSFLEMSCFSKIILNFMCVLKKKTKKHVLIQDLTQNLTLKLFIFHYI